MIGCWSTSMEHGMRLMPLPQSHLHQQWCLGMVTSFRTRMGRCKGSSNGGELACWTVVQRGCIESIKIKVLSLAASYSSPS